MNVKSGHVFFIYVNLSIQFFKYYILIVYLNVILWFKFLLKASNRQIYGNLDIDIAIGGCSQSHYMNCNIFPGQ